jgi:superfamily II DNA or RNA helicase
VSKIILANKLFIPADQVDPADLERVYEQDAFVETTCRNCPIFKKGLRPSQQCYVCTMETPGAWAGYTGHFVQWKEVNLRGKPYYAVPIGDLDEAQKELNISLDGAVDYRARPPMKVPITFTGKLFTGREIVGGKRMANQVGIVKKFWRSPYRSGIIQAPPRTGKTVLGAFFACAFKTRTLILAHEKILLDQFAREIRQHTDITAQEKLVGRRLMAIVQSEKDMRDDVEILLLNYQKLITEIGIKRVLDYLQGKYGLIEVDEIHRCGTDHYDGLINRMDARFRIGFSATPSRKDGKWFTFRRSLGPIVVKARVDTLKPTVYIKETPFKMKREFRGRAGYVKTNTWLSEQRERNIDIVRTAFTDLRENPLNVIVIPVNKIIHAKTLVAMINKQARINNEKRGESWQGQLAEILWAKSDKKQVIADVNARRIRVLVSIAKFTREGTNIPSLSHFYQIFPQNNRVSTEQGTARILTPLDGKPDPVIRYFLDPISICISCFRNTYADSFIPLKYIMAEESKETIDKFMRMKKVKGVWVDPGEEDPLVAMW